MIITVIGLGLIGGSMALDLKKRGFAERVIGVDASRQNAQDALKLRLVDEINDLENAVNNSDLVILAVPVNIISQLLPKVLDYVNEKTVVTDTGSTKEQISLGIKDHPNRKHFVPSHPMSGTENSGPFSAKTNLFDNKVAIICDKENANEWAVKTVEDMYKTLNARILYMSAADHDVHVGYVSHLSHVISYALAVAVLDKEKSASTIFDLASGGFDTTARLAKSSPDMWTPIFEQNAKNILPILDIYIGKLNLFREHLQKNEYDKIYDFIKESNEIRRVLDKKKI